MVHAIKNSVVRIVLVVIVQKVNTTYLYPCLNSLAGLWSDELVGSTSGHTEGRPVSSVPEISGLDLPSALAVAAYR